jgi:hypothetical protein
MYLVLFPPGWIELIASRVEVEFLSPSVVIVRFMSEWRKVGVKGTDSSSRERRSEASLCFFPQGNATGNDNVQYNHHIDLTPHSGVFLFTIFYIVK